MAGFLVWIALFALGGIFGPVQYHPDGPAPVYHDGGHESGMDR